MQISMKISMQCALCMVIFVGLNWGVSADATSTQTNPLAKVMQMLSKMQQDIIKEGEQQQSVYIKFSNMCETRSRQIQHNMKVASAAAEDMTATINKANDDEAEAETMIEELSAAISENEADLKAATKIREKEAADFSENQKDMLDTISQMQRAIGILEKHLRAGSSFAQKSLSVSNMDAERASALTQALSTIVDASFITVADATALAGFIQTSEDQAMGDGDAELDAATASYSGTGTVKRQGGDNAAGIMETLQNLLEKAETSLQEARSKESKSSHNFELLSQSLQQKVTVDMKEMNDVKKEKAVAGQNRAEAQGDLGVTTQDLKENQKILGDLHHECMNRAADFQDETTTRGLELKAIAEAKSILKEMTGDAGKETYGDFSQTSFLQTRSRELDSSLEMSSSMQAATLLRKLGQRQNSTSLAQMAHKLESIIRASSVSGVDPFKKVKDMISGMLGKLEKMMEEEASHKVYCDKEMTETKKNKAMKEAEVEKLRTKLDTQTSRSMHLKREITELQKEILANIKAQKEISELREKEHAFFEETKPKIELGLEGVKKALKVLREYYSQDDKGNSAGGASSGVMSMLEVIESDFAKGLAGMVAQEESSQAEYEKQTRDNTEAKALKDQGVIFKTKEMKALDKSTAESSTDLDGVQSELDAINEYFAKIQEECVAKPDTYEERRKRQEQTLQGLREAQEILEGRAALLQYSRRMRGSIIQQSDSTGSDEDAADV